MAYQEVSEDRARDRKAHSGGKLSLGLSWKLAWPGLSSSAFCFESSDTTCLACLSRRF